MKLPDLNVDTVRTVYLPTQNSPTISPATTLFNDVLLPHPGVATIGIA